MAVAEQEATINGVRLVPLSEDHEPVDFAERSDIDRLQRQIDVNAELLAKLRRYAPPVAEKRRRRVRIAFELLGLAIAGTGAWWIYPPAALLLVGTWLLGDIVVSRRAKKNA
jgi:hypothetical protein